MCLNFEPKEVADFLSMLLMFVSVCTCIGS